MKLWVQINTNHILLSCPVHVYVSTGRCLGMRAYVGAWLYVSLR